MSFMSGYIWGILTVAVPLTAWYVFTLYLEERREKEHTQAREWKMRQRRGW